MEDVDFSDEFCEFIQTCVPAVNAAEMLLLLRSRPQDWWDPPDVLHRMRAAGLAEPEGVRHLELFQARGLLATGPDKRIQFRPANGHIASQVEKLAQAYTERPVTLFRVIYALRDTRVRSFAEAFRLKRK
jgi:hypothetical protein